METFKASKVDSSFKSIIFKVQYLNERIITISHNFRISVDSVVMVNNEYVDEKCKKYYHDGYLEINFLNINLKQSDEIIVIVYTISSDQNFINSEFATEKFDKIDVIDDQINEKYLIENKYGMINKKFIIKKNDDEILKLSSLDIWPTYISIDKNEIDSLSKIKSILSYFPIETMKTFNIQYGIDTNVISWENNTVRINHGLGTDVNFIIDRNDSRRMIKTVKKIDNNNLEISFNNMSYDPNVFSITIFKIGE